MENLLYDGGSFMVFQAGDPENVTIRFTDAITAFSGIKKAVIKGKGKLNAAIASMVAGYLEDKGIYSHFIERSGEDGILCRKVDDTAGSYCPQCDCRYHGQKTRCSGRIQA